jgi:hypothetical protein
MRPANAELVDYTRTLEFLVGPIIAEGCSVILDERQYPILVSYLEKIAAIGDINFRLEMCVDHRPGHSVAWDNDGDRIQDDEVDRLMGELVQSLAFDAGSVANPGVIADPAEILNRIHRADVQQNPPTSYVSDAVDMLNDPELAPSLEMTRQTIYRCAHVHGISSEQIAKLYNLDLDFVRQEIRRLHRRKKPNRL